MCACLLAIGPKCAYRVVDFTATVTHRDDLAVIVADGALHRGKGTRAVDVSDIRLGSEGAGPFQVEVAFQLRAVVAGIAAAVQNHLGIVRRQIETGLEALQVGEEDVRLANHRDGHAGSVKPGLIERSDVVDSREIFRHEVMRGSAIVERGGRGHRLPVEIVQTTEPGDDVRQSVGDGHVGRVGEMFFALHLKAMDRAVKRIGDLSGGPGERDPIASARLFVDGEAFGLEPRGHFGEIAGAETEALTELLGRQPFMKLRRRRVLLVGEQRVQFRLLRGRSLEHDLHIFHAHRGISRALVVLRASQAVYSSRQHACVARIYPAGDSIGNRAIATHPHEQSECNSNFRPHRFNFSFRIQNPV